MVQQQPGDQILGGILSGQVDLFSLAPAFPHESPMPFIPRYLAKRLWPGGIQPFQPAAVIPPAAQPPANQVRPPAQPAPRVAAQPAVPARPPRKRVLERGTFPEWH